MVNKWENKRFVCERCGFKTGDKRYLQNHINSKHENKKAFKCPKCEDRYFVDIFSLRKHIKSFHEKLYKCKQCGNSFCSAHALRYHLRAVHKEITHMKCNYCDFQGVSKKELKSHSCSNHGLIKQLSTTEAENVLRSYLGKLQTENITCVYCKKVFTSLQTYQKHIEQDHVGKRGYRCPLCKFTTAQPKNIVAHVHTAHSKRHLKCKYCLKFYLSETNLAKHYKKHHEQDTTKVESNLFEKFEKNYQVSEETFEQSTNQAINIHSRTKHQKNLNNLGKISTNESFMLEQPNSSILESNTADNHSPVTPDNFSNIHVNELVNEKDPLAVQVEDKLNKALETNEDKIITGDIIVNVIPDKFKNDPIKDDDDQHLASLSSLQRDNTIESTKTSSETSLIEQAEGLKPTEIRTIGEKTINVNTNILKNTSNLEMANLSSKKNAGLKKWQIKRFFCDKCDYKASDPRYLQSHINAKHDNIRPFKCNKCEKSFTDKNKLQEHIKGFHDLIYKCKICEKLFFYSESLKHHMRTIHMEVKKFKCKLCDFVSIKQSAVKEHANNVHDGKTALSQEEVENTLSTFSNCKTVKCLYCENVFWTNELYMAHIESDHPGLNGFACPVCTFTSNRLKDMEHHIRVEHSRKSLKCDYCDRYFTLEGYRVRHMIQEHNNNTSGASNSMEVSNDTPDANSFDTLKQNYASDNADMSSINFQERLSDDNSSEDTTDTNVYSNINEHDIDISEEMEDEISRKNAQYLEELENEAIKEQMVKQLHYSFKCSQCPKKYTTGHTLRRHYRSAHLKTADFFCPKCHYSCMDARALRKHMETKHGEPQYKPVNQIYFNNMHENKNDHSEPENNIKIADTSVIMKENNMSSRPPHFKISQTKPTSHASRNIKYSGIEPSTSENMSQENKNNLPFKTHEKIPMVNNKKDTFTKFRPRRYRCKSLILPRSSFCLNEKDLPVSKEQLNFYNMTRKPPEKEVTHNISFQNHKPDEKIVKSELDDDLMAVVALADDFFSN